MAQHLHLVAAIQNLTTRIQNQDDIGQRLFGLASQAETAVSGIVHLKNNPSPTANAAANFIALQDNAKKLEAWRVKAVATLNAIIKDAYGAAETQLKQKVDLTPNPKFEREYRDVYRGLSSALRAPYLANLAITNNGPALAAITETDHALTGIPDDMAADFRKLIWTTNAPAEFDAMTKVNELVEPVWAILDVVKSAVEMFSDAYKLRDIEQARVLADAAQQSLNATLTA